MTDIHGEDDREYLPLPHYPWDERPAYVEVTTDEAATAIHLAHGSVSRAASRLKISCARLSRMVRASPYLKRIYQDHVNETVDRAGDEYIHALWDEDSNDRRREAAAAKVLASRAAMASENPFVAAGSNAAQLQQEGGRIVISWIGEDDSDKLIEGTISEPASAAPEDSNPL